MDVSALFGINNDWADVLAARAQARSFTVDRNQTVDSVKQTISRATRLDESGKNTLTNLTNTVDTFAKGDAKLLRDIASISNLMQFGQKEQFSTQSPYAQLLSAAYTQKTGGFVDLLG